MGGAEILVIFLVGSVVIGFVAYNTKKTNKNAGIPDKELSEIDIQLKQLEYLKNIQKQSERSALNLAFITWFIIISLIITFFLYLSNLK
ncbi:hypothetical protein [Myroides sp. DF42-4-2]|uniref:hypothetical protein n=1 Tax=unclassified Myroides TaxID=2642485 RepID=UPI0025766550|nr:hypothetical protein [Myroides sp. DF42-4-2]MDM1408586.1 hypothetical protein [Myroides sp. DF42-4-2]